MNVTKNINVKNVTEFFTMELDYSSLKEFLNNLTVTVNKQGESIH